MLRFYFYLQYTDDCININYIYGIIVHPYQVVESVFYNDMLQCNSSNML